MTKTRLVVLTDTSCDDKNGFIESFRKQAAANDCDVLIMPRVGKIAGFEIFSYFEGVKVAGICVDPGEEITREYVDSRNNLPIVYATGLSGEVCAQELLARLGLMDIKKPSSKNTKKILSAGGAGINFHNDIREYLSKVTAVDTLEEAGILTAQYSEKMFPGWHVSIYHNGNLPRNPDESFPPLTVYYYLFKESDYYALAVSDGPGMPGEDFRMWIAVADIALCHVRELLSGRNGRMNLEAAMRSFGERPEDETVNGRIRQLSAKEKDELDKVKKILDSNLLTYHFQPIVSAETGEIVSYEALMRPRAGAGLDGIIPYHILKYAEVMGRLGDIEKATFLNVMSIMRERGSDIGERKIFINSIPGARLLPDDYVDIEAELWKHTGHIVVEMTEQTEADAERLKAIKKRYEKLGIDIALDDYGTGYSNIVNLLQYVPKYVKIDRSLLAGIERHPKKKRFVKDIIDFCHDNGILALAEGVETWRELRMVISLGADLIQGFYVAKPTPEIIFEIDGDIKREIVRYQGEYQAGREQPTYEIDEMGRLNLQTLDKSQYSCINVGRGDDPQTDVVLAGEPEVRYNAHIDVAAGYKGSITLENVHLFGSGGKPSIAVGENCDLKLILIGDNRLEKGCICVPDGSKLTVGGAGNLSISVDIEESYGIGNDLASKHGDLYFEQDGTINIVVNGKSGICIGSGLGGCIELNHGKYNLEVNCENGVALGSYNGNGSVTIQNCELNVGIAVTRGVGIGSVEHDANILVSHSSVKANVEGTEVITFGTIGGATANVTFMDASVNCSLRGEYIIGMGALGGKTNYKQERVTLRVTGNGSHALAYGGYSEEVWIDIVDSDTAIDIYTAIQKDTMAPEGNMHIKHGKNKFTINGYPYHHTVDYE
ncbi:MAG: EAL domain-containing protein [Lachnospiraceae bacterium]|nr:EAL domain-containing protein [Lachnospiraceae bacterium]